MTENELQHRLDELEKKLVRSEDMIAIKNVLNNHLLYFQAADVNNCLADFAFERDDVCVELEREKLVGEGAIRAFYDRLPKKARMPGALEEREAASQVIEIAGDGQTAKVVCYSPGYKCLGLAGSQIWNAGKYFVDFIKIDGQWKIWHIQWSVVAEGDAALGWLYQNRSYWRERVCKETRFLGEPAGGPAPSAFIDWYKNDEFFVMLPEPPEPYAAYDGYTAAKNTRGY